MLFKRGVALLALAAGSLGVAGCMTGVYAVWQAGARLDQASERVFAMIDKGLAAAQDRLRAVQERLKESKIVTRQIAQTIRERRASKTKERLVSAAEIERRAEKLTEHIQLADQWLETLTEAIRSILQIQELGTLVGAPQDAILLENVLEELTSVRGRLQDVQRSISSVRDFTDNRGDESEENRLTRILRLLGSTDLAADAMDQGLETSINRLNRVQADVQQGKTRVDNYLLLASVGGYLVLAWIAAGQIALSLWGWKTIRYAGN